MNLEVLFMLLVTIITVVFLIIRNFVPILQQKIQNKHELELKEYEIELTELELRKLQLQQSEINLDKENEELTKITEKRKEQKECCKHKYNNNLFDTSITTKINDELEEIINRIELLELKVFNNIKEPKIDIDNSISDSEDERIPSIDELD